MTPNRFESILVVLDGTASAWSALDVALAFCRDTGAQLTVLTMAKRLPRRASPILGSQQATAVRARHADSALEQARVFASYVDVEIVAHREVASSWKVLAEYACSHRNDLIVVGDGQSFVRRRPFGLTVNPLARRTRCPVLIVPWDVSTEPAG